MKVRVGWRSLALSGIASIVVAGASAGAASAALLPSSGITIGNLASVSSAGVSLANGSLANISSAGVTTLGLAVAGADCVTQSFSQPFVNWGDQNEYTLAPGQNADAFNGVGWALDAGASVAGATVYDGARGTVLNLPSGAVAISAPVCVESNYPTARTMIRGGSVSVGVVYSDLLAGGLTPDLLQSTLDGSIAGGASFGPSGVFSVNPGSRAGYQIVQFVLDNTSRSAAQLYDFYVDPRMSH